MVHHLKKFLKEYIDHHYENWDISIALRYLPIVEDLKKLHRFNETILEIGSEITGITTYLKKVVVGIDKAFDWKRRNNYLIPIEGNALDLPFDNHTFDYVLSVDMLEHIQTKKREKAVKEMLRVTKKKMYLSFPCGHEATQADHELYLYYLVKRGEEYPYLKEHLMYGLPEAEHIKEILKSQKKCNLKIIGNTNVWLWVMLLKLGLSGQPRQSSLYRRFLLLLPILKHFNFGPTYRKLFIVEKLE